MFPLGCQAHCNNEAYSSIDNIASDRCLGSSEPVFPTVPRNGFNRLKGFQILGMGERKDFGVRLGLWELEDNMLLDSQLNFLRPLYSYLCSKDNNT